MPLQRFGRLFSRAARIPWLVVLLGFIETAERIEFVGAKTRGLGGFLMTPLGALSITLAGLLSLFLVVLWPDLKKRWSWLPLGKTIHERVHEIESEKIPALLQSQDRNHRRITDTSLSLSSVTDKYQELSNSLELTTQALGLAVKRDGLIIQALTAVPAVIQRLSEYDRLLWEATNSRDELYSIMKSYPSSPFSAGPLSVAWRPTGEAVPLREDIIAGIAWIRLLEIHFRRVVDLCNDRVDQNHSDQLMGKLCQSLNQHSAISGEQVSGLVTSHVISIRNLRKDYAAAVAGNFLAISTRSEIDHTC